MGTSTNLINGGWRFGTFATLLACSILLSFLIYLYQGSSLSPFELIKSIRTKAMTAPAPTQTPAPAPTTSQAPAPTLTPVVAPVAATVLMPTMASISAAPTPTPTVTITSPETLANTSIDIVIGKPKSVANTSSLLLDDTTYDKLLMNESKVKECNIFDGKWVYDPKKSPLYKNRLCPFLSDQVSCRRNGRPEFEYEKWRWEAKDCQIPKWNGKEILERLRGKRVIIAGDSLNRNQWESLSCLLYSAISPRRAYVRSGSRPKIFKAKDYNCTIEFFWSPFLVQFDETKRVGHRVLNIDKLSPFAKQWRGADVMIFNTGYWWTRKIQRWDLYQHKGKLVKDVKLETAFQIAMKTWANWVDLNVDPAKTTVVFRSISAIHKEEQWCFNQTQPINDDSYITPFRRSLIEIILKTIKQMRTPTKYLNITKLSEYRKDAHPTIYTTKRGKLLTIEQRREPELYADCNHWCLPGVPDTWNSLLFTSLFLDSVS